MNTDISFGTDKTKTKKADHYSKTASETVAVSQTAVNKESFRDYFQWRLIHSISILSSRKWRYYKTK